MQVKSISLSLLGTIADIRAIELISEPEEATQSLAAR
jgi:hypothetical protein